MRKRFLLLLVMLAMLSCTRGVRMDEPRPYPQPGGNVPATNACHAIGRSACDAQCGGKSDLVTYQCRNGNRYTRCEASHSCP